MGQGLFLSMWQVRIKICGRLGLHQMYLKFVSFAGGATGQRRGPDRQRVAACPEED